MPRFGKVSGDVKGNLNFLGQVSFAQGVGGANTPGSVYYVDRDKQNDLSGDGRSWDDAFVTITEAINAVNADYTNGTAPSEGRNRYIYIAEGYYSEVPVTLTASDVHIICVAPGGHDSTVFYGSATAGGWDAGTTAAAITITGDNNTIYGLGIVNRSAGLYPAVAIGIGTGSAIANKLINCKITLDALDSCTYGIEDMGNAFTEIIGCEFSASCKTAGVRLYSATTNSRQIRIKDCYFYGCPTGVLIDAAAHDAVIEDCMFLDDTAASETCDTPILNNAGTGLIVFGCSSQLSTANLVTGSGTSHEGNNFELA